jgi:hypothetical protein
VFGSNECNGGDAAIESSPYCRPPLVGTYSDVGSVVIGAIAVEERLLLRSSSLMTPAMSGNCIP